MTGMEYRIVPDHYRKRVSLKNKKNHKPVKDPLIQDLLQGKTVFIEAKVQLGGRSPFRTMYSFFSSRGYRLRMHKYDDLDKNVYGGILMWAESPLAR